MNLFRRIQTSICHRHCEYLNRNEASDLAHALGVHDATHTDLDTLESLATIKACLRRSVDVLVDVGAHKGTFASAAMQALSARKAICFEPNPTLHAELRTALRSLDAEVRGCALAAIPGRMTLHIHRDPQMSSLLVSDRQVLQRDFSHYDSVHIEDVSVVASTLDDELQQMLDGQRRCFLKLDTQGNELDVLSGGTKSLAICEGVLLEYMFTSPYLGQAAFADVVLFMQSAGFHCAGPLHTFRRESGRISGVDFLFIRT